MTSTLVCWGLLGFLTHFISCWAEYCKTTEKLTPVKYVERDTAGWIAACVGSLMVILLAPDVFSMLQVTLPITPRLEGALMGYAGSSLIPKLLGMVGLTTGER